MSLPPGFLDELRNRLSLAQVVGRKVMWDQRKSNQAKGDMWAPCPFHQEKSASFHVDDQKGFYYCFGCHAKGDAIGFVKETENVGFMEAVEILAREAGMQMPARDPQAQEKADRRTQLAEVLETAVQYYRLQLKTNSGAGAREYLERRGLKEDARERWHIGFAPDAWQGLLDHLKAKGFSDDLILGAGLAKASSKGKSPYDVFRNRIMFPIRDARGRAIAFGGRAMDPADKAKYLNSPETELFDKGRSLFNHGPAREAAGKGQPLVVAEGYMDVIALSEAGFRATVAPLGTAITETQLQLLWRMTPEPVIALDGDAAGLRAAMRVIDLALPMLSAGQSVRFAILPEGLDPDDLIKAQGAGAMEKVLEGALPLVQLLWQRETEGKVFDSPERRSALDAALGGAIAKIADQNLRHHYEQALKDLKWQLFNPRRNQAGGAKTPWQPGPKRGFGKGFQPILPPTAHTKGSLLAAASGHVDEVLREAVILATLIVHPRLIETFETAFERIHMATPEHVALQNVILSYHGDDSEELRAEISSQCGPQSLEKLFALNHVTIAPPIRRAEDGELAAMCLAEELAKLDAARGARREIAEATADFDALVDEGLTWRLSEATRALDEARRGKGEDKGLYDRADNGVLLAREERAALDALLKLIDGEPGKGSS
ncbi:DNA primase [Maritimibacter sp. DP1N21-5]|uniref:DNA primase n=1 Tax=Maritimibacter sp. DP1N21-5 TaxID=2836867 RepID=UPI001C496E33|nr:DNA primase [Maritimibacter sp. DP1N21-5]MBV7410223.1 DNA primase [Maritimibacter sp. DP1N21-5]